MDYTINKINHSVVSKTKEYAEKKKQTEKQKFL